MAERYLYCLDTLRSPHHEPGVLFDVTAIVLRVLSAEARTTALDLRGSLVSTGPGLVEVVYPRGLPGFESVSRAVAYNEQSCNTRALARDDTLVLTALGFRLVWGFAWADGVRLLHLSADGAKGVAGRTPPELFWSPGAPLTEAEHARLQGEILDWSRPQPVRGPTPEK